VWEDLNSPPPTDTKNLQLHIKLPLKKDPKTS